MTERWYLVCDVDELDEVRRSRPVVAGTARVSRGGKRALVRLSRRCEGAINQAEARKLLSRKSWRRSGAGQ